MAEALRRGQLTVTGSTPGTERCAPMVIPRLAPWLTVAILLAPLLFGLAGTVLPAFGYLPALGGGHLTVAYFEALFAKPGIVASALLALFAGLATTALALLVVMVFVAGWAGTRSLSRLQHLVSPLLSVPHAAAAFGLAFLIAPSGFLMRLVSPWLTGFERPPDWLIVNDPLGLSMIAGLVVKEVPFLLLVTLAALPQAPVVEARRLASAFGYGRIAGFAYLLAPRIYGQIRLAVYAVLAYASSVVDVATILGPQLPGTLPVRLLEWMRDPELATRFLASAGALLQLAVTLTALLAWYCAERLVGAIARSLCARGIRFRRDDWLRRAGFAAMAVSAAAIGMGLLVLAIWSVAGLWQFPDIFPSTVTARTWLQALPRIAAPIATTVAVGLTAAAIATLLVVACLEREAETGRTGGARSLFLIYLPLIVPQISFVFGLQVLAIAAGTSASFAGLTAVHLVFVLPFVFLSLSDPWRAYDKRYEVIAAGLGQSRLKILMRVRLPMLSRAILTAAAVGFAVSVGQYLPTVLIGAGRLTTITTEAVALASGGNGRVIGVYAFFQTVLPFFGFAIASVVPALLFRNRRAMRL